MKKPETKLNRRIYFTLPTENSMLELRSRAESSGKKANQLAKEAVISFIEKEEFKSSSSAVETALEEASYQLRCLPSYLKQNDPKYQEIIDCLRVIERNFEKTARGC